MFKPETESEAYIRQSDRVINGVPPPPSRQQTQVYESGYLNIQQYNFVPKVQNSASDLSVSRQERSPSPTKRGAYGFGQAPAPFSTEVDPELFASQTSGMRFSSMPPSNAGSELKAYNPETNRVISDYAPKVNHQLKTLRLNSDVRLSKYAPQPGVTTALQQIQEEPIHSVHSPKSFLSSPHRPAATDALTANAPRTPDEPQLSPGGLSFGPPTAKFLPRTVELPPTTFQAPPRPVQHVGSPSEIGLIPAFAERLAKNISQSQNSRLQDFLRLDPFVVNALDGLCFFLATQHFDGIQSFGNFMVVVSLTCVLLNFLPTTKDLYAHILRGYFVLRTLFLAYFGLCSTFTFRTPLPDSHIKDFKHQLHALLHFVCVLILIATTLPLGLRVRNLFEDLKTQED